MTRPADSQPTVAELLGGPVRMTAITPAAELAPVTPRTFLHSGPPLQTDELSGALRGAVIAGLLFEGEAADVTAAEHLIDAGEITLLACQDHGVAGPLTGVVTPTTPMVVVEHARGYTAATPLHEGDHGGLRTGMFDEATLARLAWIRRTIAPALAEIVTASDPIDITDMQSSGLRRGDECHNRNIASTLALTARLAPSVVRHREAVDLIDYLTTTSQLFISLSAAAAKATADTLHAEGRPGLVTGMGLNGHEFGIRVSGLPGWATAPAPIGPMVPLDGGDISRSGRGQGDSPIIESIGLGAFSLTAAPALAQAFGLSVAEAAELVAELRQIVAAEHPRFLLPADEWLGAPAVIDVARVAATGIVPRTTLGFMDREPGRGRVGVGLVPLPIEPFREAAGALP